MLSEYLNACLVSLILKFNTNFRAPIDIGLIDIDISDLNHLECLRIATLNLVPFHDNIFIFLPVLTLMHIDSDSLSLFLQFKNILSLLKVRDFDNVEVSII
jgi:hypothetical protein